MPLVSVWSAYRSHFRRNPNRDAAIYLLFLVPLITYSLICIFGELYAPHCDPDVPEVEWPNPKFNGDNCMIVRYWALLGLNRLECELGRRILSSILLGSIIGYERRSPDRPAGIRTLSIVCLGACCFTITSMFSFQSGYMEWDASRVAAAIPSGVGFLGAGVIWKGMQGKGPDQTHQVHGITTAASMWLSAAVGVAAGGGLYFLAAVCVGCVVLMLRFGPRGTSDDVMAALHSSGLGSLTMSTTGSTREEVSPNIDLRVPLLHEPQAPPEDARQLHRRISLHAHT